MTLKQAISVLKLAFICHERLCKTALRVQHLNRHHKPIELDAISANVLNASSTDETEIPISVIKQIDEGKRPMARMVERILSVGKTNEVTKGKANVFAEFEKSLEKELGEKK